MFFFRAWGAVEGLINLHRVISHTFFLELNLKLSMVLARELNSKKERRIRDSIIIEVLVFDRHTRSSLSCQVSRDILFYFRGLR